MTSADDEIAALKAAAQKARDDAQKLAKELGKDIDVSRKSTATETLEQQTPAASTLSASEVQSLIQPINFDTGDASTQIESLNSLVDSKKINLWNAANTSNANTNSPIPIKPYPVSLSFLEQRTSGKITGASLGVVDGEDDVSLSDFKDATVVIVAGCSVLGVAALALLPENVGATVCYLMAIIPILWLGVGSTAPGIIAGGIAASRGDTDDKEAREDRICRHEAGHFLCGYLCGLPVRSYAIADSGFPCVEFHSCAEGETRRELIENEIAVLSVVAMSGSVAEALKLGKARGGDSDLLELDGFYRRSEEFIGAAKQQELTRWGALAAYNLITANEDKYEKLVVAFREKKSVSECIAAIESA